VFIEEEFATKLAVKCCCGGWGKNDDDESWSQSSIRIDHQDFRSRSVGVLMNLLQFNNANNVMTKSIRLSYPIE